MSFCKCLYFNTVIFNWYQWKIPFFDWTCAFSDVFFFFILIYVWHKIVLHANQFIYPLLHGFITAVHNKYIYYVYCVFGSETTFQSMAFSRQVCRILNNNSLFHRRMLIFIMNIYQGFEKIWLVTIETIFICHSNHKKWNFSLDTITMRYPPFWKRNRKRKIFGWQFSQIVAMCMKLNTNCNFNEICTNEPEWQWK